MFLMYQPVVLYGLVAFFGLCLGSFLNSWMWRVHSKKWRWGDRSRCVHCQRALAWYENIPLISFVVLRGRCRTCRRSIPASYFLVELVTALLFVLITWYHEQQPAFEAWRYARDLGMVAVLLVTFVYDLKYMLVLSGLTWAAAVLGGVANYYFGAVSLGSIVLGVVVGGGFFLIQYVISRGRWVGGGDVRLGVMMGAWLGFPNIVAALLVSYVLGALAAIPLLVSGKKQGSSAIPFGTFLAVGTALALWFGTPAIAWYASLFTW